MLKFSLSIEGKDGDPGNKNTEKKDVLSRGTMTRYWPVGVLIITVKAPVIWGKDYTRGRKEIYRGSGRPGIGQGKTLYFLKIKFAKVCNLLQGKKGWVIKKKEEK